MTAISGQHEFPEERDRPRCSHHDIEMFILEGREPRTWACPLAALEDARAQAEQLAAALREYLDESPKPMTLERDSHKHAEHRDRAKLRAALAAYNESRSEVPQP